MAIQTLSTLKSYFNTGDKPTETQFASLLESTTTTAVSAATTLTTSATSAAIPAITIPANSLISNFFVVITTQITIASSGNIGAKVGDGAGEADLAAAVANCIINGATTGAVGKGTASSVEMNAGLGGNAVLPITAAKGYCSTSTEVHFTITATENFSAGAVICGVQYVPLA